MQGAMPCCSLGLRPFIVTTRSHMATLSPAFVASSERFERWYDSKDADTQALIEEISTLTSFIIDEAEYDAFIKMLDSHVGITNC